MRFDNESNYKGWYNDTADDYYQHLIRQCLNENVNPVAEEVSTRNSKVQRIIGDQCRFKRTPLVSIRKTSWKSAIREWEWFMSGSSNINDLHPSVRHWWEPFCKVDKQTLCYNYGQVLRRLYAPGCGEDVVVEPKLLVDGPVPIPHWKHREVDSGDAVHIGYVGTNSHGDTFRVISHLGGSEYEVQFDSNGYVVASLANNFRKGIVKNPYYPTVLKVACYGRVEADDYAYYDRAYGLWTDILNRCYNSDRTNWKWYGGVGVKVHPRWRCFEYFIKDLSQILGFEEWLLNPGLYDLDKDYHKADYYGPGVCVFLPHSLNVQLSKSEEYTERRPDLFVDQVKQFVEGIKQHPNSRRNILTTWIPHHVESGLMNPTNCHNTVTQAFVVGGDRLRLVTYQRSVDVICGLSHNWIQQAAFQLWLCHQCKLKVDGLTWIGGDIHIYEKHYELAKKMLEVDPPVSVPTLCYEPTSDEFNAEDFYLDGEYKPVLTDKAEMVV